MRLGYANGAGSAGTVAGQVGSTMMAGYGRVRPAVPNRPAKPRFDRPNRGSIGDAAILSAKPGWGAPTSSNRDDPDRGRAILRCLA